MYLRFSSLAIIFMILSQTINGILQGIGKVNIPAISFGTGMIFKFLCNIILIPNRKIGIYGAIIGNIVCNVVAFFIGITVLHKNVNVKFEFKKYILKPVLATVFMTVIAGFTNQRLQCINLKSLAIIVSIIVGITSYFVSLLILRVFSKDEIELLKDAK